eukprot:GEMP01036977.1.p1 GENE.GEMP01036977.1~~GEMP01036977.1.p1  ORF type:complete len:263 (+),score=44.67 GEMP01036977.1:120-908(+)
MHELSFEGDSRVRLHVYDIDIPFVPTMNWFTKWAGVLPLGGIFHVGIEVYDLEFTFGSGDFDTGIFWGCPGFVETSGRHTVVDLGETLMSHSEVGSLVQKMCREWPATSYDVLNNNCCTFCRSFAEKLGCEEKVFPAWADRFARSARWLSRVYATGRSDSWHSALSLVSNEVREVSSSFFASRFRQFSDKSVESHAKDTIEPDVDRRQSSLLGEAAAQLSAFLGIWRVPQLNVFNFLVHIGVKKFERHGSLRVQVENFPVEK